ncbi:MAG: hypothetical protein MK214_06510 [Thalassotalea sp.]|nr:hypothetical protein [Thalassotalea sp.]
MEEILVMEDIKVDGLLANTTAAHAYEEQLEFELNNSEFSRLFPLKADMTRYSISENNCDLGDYGILSIKPQASRRSRLVTLSRR